MWPFTSKRIFGNRWWAISFVVFVCWQAVEMTGSDRPTKTIQADNQTDVSGVPVDPEQDRALENMIAKM